MAHDLEQFWWKKRVNMVNERIAKVEVATGKKTGLKSGRFGWKKNLPHAVIIKPSRQLERGNW